MKNKLGALIFIVGSLFYTSSSFSNPIMEKEVRFFVNLDAAVEACTGWIKELSSNGQCSADDIVYDFQWRVLYSCEYLFPYSHYRTDNSCESSGFLLEKTHEVAWRVTDSCPDSHPDLKGYECHEEEDDNSYTPLYLGRMDGVSGCSVGNPINFLTGNKFEKEIDITIPFSEPLVVSRTYNSNQRGWTFNLVPSLEINVDVDTGDAESAIIKLEDGKNLFFNPFNGGFVADSHYEGELLISTDDNGVPLSPVQYEFVRPNGTVYYFDQNADVFRVEFVGGDFWLFYDNKVEGSSGQLIEVHRSNEGISKILLDQTLEVNYSYNDSGILSEVIYPDGSTKSYLYEDSNDSRLLTGVVDESGTLKASWAYDSLGMAISSKYYSNGTEVGVYTIDYSEMNSDDPGVTVTNPLGKEATYKFSEIAKERKLTFVEGHQSANCIASNRSYTYYSDTGLVESKTDWNGNVTYYEYNDRGLETKVIESHGTDNERVMSIEWHSRYSVPTRVITGGRKVDYLYNEKGMLIRETVSPAGLTN